MMKKIIIFSLVLATVMFISGCVDQSESANNTTSEVVTPSESIETAQLLTDAVPSENITADLDAITSGVDEENITVENLTDEEVIKLELENK